MLLLFLLFHFTASYKSLYQSHGLCNSLTLDIFLHCFVKLPVFLKRWWIVETIPDMNTKQSGFSELWMTNLIWGISDKLSCGVGPLPPLCEEKNKQIVYLVKAPRVAVVSLASETSQPKWCKLPLLQITLNILLYGNVFRQL